MGQTEYEQWTEPKDSPPYKSNWRGDDNVRLDCKCLDRWENEGGMIPTAHFRSTGTGTDPFQ